MNILFPTTIILQWWIKNMRSKKRKHYKVRSWWSLSAHHSHVETLWLQYQDQCWCTASVIFSDLTIWSTSLLNANRQFGPDAGVKHIYWCVMCYCSKETHTTYTYTCKCINTAGRYWVWEVCVVLRCVSSSGWHDIMCSDPQTWVSPGCSPGPNQTPTWQPFKCPRSLVLCNDTLLAHHPQHTQPSADARRGPARSFYRTSVPLFAIGAERQKKKKSPKTAESSRRCAERGGGPENTAERRTNSAPEAPGRNSGCNTDVISHILDCHYRAPAPPEPGHHPMRHGDGSSSCTASR